MNSQQHKQHRSATLTSEISDFIYGNYKGHIENIYKEIHHGIKPKNLVTECHTLEDKREENMRQCRLIAEKKLDIWFQDPVSVSKVPMKSSVPTNDEVSNDCADKNDKCVTSPATNTQVDYLNRVFTMMAFWDAGMVGQVSVTLHQLFCSTIESLGTLEFHGQFFRTSPNVRSLYTFGCFALTEVTHGSDTKNMQTCAVYNPENQTFDLHTPGKEAAKFWIGNLAKHATHALVAAQLYVETKCYGLHWFVVPVRDQVTHKTLPGIIIGDVGRKTSHTWDAMDNGFVMFDHYSLPRTSMLNRYQEITPEGNYVIKVKDKNTHFGLTLGALSGGRVGIAFDVVSRSRLSLAIAVRYSHARKQFGVPEEKAIISYQYQQFRLMPRLASFYCMHFFGLSLHKWYQNLREMTLSGDITSEFVDLNSEIHALSCGFKAVSSWHARDTMQICRECCGGHGFAAFSRLTSLKEDMEPSLTYEGDNNVILMQVAKYLLQALMTLRAGNSVSSPLGSLNYINDTPKFFQQKCSVESSFKSVDEIKNALKWKSIYLLTSSAKKLTSLSKNSEFNVATDLSQAFYLHDSVEAHFNSIIFEEALKNINMSTHTNVRHVLTQCVLIFGLWSLIGKDSTSSILLEGGYMTPKQMTLAREELLDWCKELADDSLSLVNAVCPPDYILQCAIAPKDLNYTSHMFNTIFQEENVFQRPRYWRILREGLNSKL